MIPKKIFMIWLGGPLPPIARDLIVQTSALNAGWEFQLIHEVPAEMPQELKDAVANCSFFCSQSDIISYWLLHTYGGIYLDTDFDVIRNLEPLRQRGPFIGMVPNGLLACAAMGCEAGSPEFGAVLDMVKALAPSVPASRTSYGPNLLRQAVDAGVSLNVLPTHYFYIDRSRPACQQFWAGDSDFRAQWLRARQRVITDDESPFAVHLWGVPVKTGPQETVRSGVRRCTGATNRFV